MTKQPFREGGKRANMPEGAPPRPAPKPTYGCICPPTSEKTCRLPVCPRKDHRSMGQKMRDNNP